MSASNRMKRTNTLTSAEEILRMPEVGIEIPVADLYEGLSFSSDVDADEP